MDRKISIPSVSRCIKVCMVFVWGTSVRPLR